MATFNFTFDPGTTVQQMLGMEIAGRVWGRYLTDNTTLNIHVGVSSGLDNKTIGGALPGMRAAQKYSDYYAALAADRTSADDNRAVSSLSTSDDYVSAFTYVDKDLTQTQTEKQKSLNMTRAVAKAAELNLANGSTALDGYIMFSDLANTKVGKQSVNWSYDYTRSGVQANNTLDFLSTAIHEIGHILGFVSAVDAPGLLGMQTDRRQSKDGKSSSDYINGMKKRLANNNPLDLFRYAELTTAKQKTSDMSYGNDNGRKFLSFDGGNTVVAEFATGSDTNNGGDGYQASHWKNGTNGIMNPTLKVVQRSNITSIDLRALDVIGWDIAATGINTRIDLSALNTTSQQALAARAGQGSNAATWVASNLTASPTQLVANRDLAIYTMMQDSMVYDMTRVTAPSATGWTTRQTLAQVFQQRSLFSTVDELEGLVPETLPLFEITGLGSDGASLATLNFGDRLSAATPAELAMDLGVPSALLLPIRQILVAVMAEPSFSQQSLATGGTALESPMMSALGNEDLRISGNLVQTRAYDSGVQRYWHDLGQAAEAGSPDRFPLDDALLAGLPVF
jgi:hypothetical protein